MNFQTIRKVPSLLHGRRFLVIDFSSWEEYIAPNKGLETNTVGCTCRLETKVLNNTTSRRHVGEVILTAVYNINELW